MATEMTQWKGLIPILLPASKFIQGEHSLERPIQAQRERSTLPILNFPGQKLPDSPNEVDAKLQLQRIKITYPETIPKDGNSVKVYDFRGSPWPKPKKSTHCLSLPSHLPVTQQQHQHQQFSNYGLMTSGSGHKFINAHRGMNLKEWDEPMRRNNTIYGRENGGRHGDRAKLSSAIHYSSSTPHCWYFMRGSCRFEKRCKFLHPFD